MSRIEIRRFLQLWGGSKVENMKRSISVILLVVLFAMTLIFVSGCGVVGANVRLEGLNLGTVAMDGKPLAGLPSDKINLNLAVGAQTIKVSTSGNQTVLTLLPSGGTITVDGSTVSFKGLKSDQVKVEWAAAPAP